MIFIPWLVDCTKGLPYMNAQKFIYYDLPAVLKMPKEFQHHSVKITITPLTDNEKSTNRSAIRPANCLSNFAGKWKGAPLLREDQGKYEERNRLK